MATATASACATTEPATDAAATDVAPLEENHPKATTRARAQTNLSRIVQAALLKTLVHSIRRGSVEGVKVAIERNVAIKYVDSSRRNLIMSVTSSCFSCSCRSRVVHPTKDLELTLLWVSFPLWCVCRIATKYDTDARLQIVVILADAGCGIMHTDQAGWTCLHYAW